MPKLRLSSWLQSPSKNRTATDEQKKQNRRSFSAFSSVSPFKPKQSESGDSIKQTNSVTDMASTTSPSETGRLVALAQQITRETEKLDKYLKANNLPVPSFDADAPADFPKLPEDIAQSRQAVIHATKELRDLAIGPREGLRWGVWGYLDVLALQLVNHYGIAKLFPADSTITLAELQGKVTLDAVNLARVLRTAMLNHIFREPSPGVIAHTAASRLLAEDDELQAWLGFNAEDIFPASAHVLPAIKTHPEATSLKRAGFQFAFNTVDQEPMFVTFGKDPLRAKRMGRAMVSLTGGEGYEPKFLVDVEGGGYDFSEIDDKEGTLVDVGGSHGFMCVELAKRYKKMKFVVQDLPKTVDSAPKPICDDEQAAGRIEMMAHDFFTEQAVKGADVYFFRWIIHNYSTPFAIQILKNLVPALKPGARIVINDHCLREPGQENPWDEGIMRRMDMVMLTLLNAQERTEAEFRDLFKAAGDGFVFKGVLRPKGCRMSIVEAVWKPDEVESAKTEAPAPAAGIAVVQTNGTDATDAKETPLVNGVNGTSETKGESTKVADAAVAVKA